ncbi:MAG: hypothetical protein AB7O62_01205 [Pirellulales bacterium]
MSILLTMLILAASPPASNDGPSDEVVKAFRADFDDKADRNYDRWPDGWKRQRGKGYPHYVQIKLAALAGQPGQAVRVDLDGGAAALYSPAIPISSEYSYVAEARIRTHGLKRDEAYLTVTMVDDQNRRVEQLQSERIREAADWVKVKIGPTAAGQSRAVAAVLGLHVTPTSGHDITGTVWFDDVWLGRLPSISLETSAPLHLYLDAEQVEIVCRASGLQGLQTTLQLSLEDAQGEPVDSTLRRLDDIATARGNSSSDRLVLRWRPKITAAGFYRARVTMQGRDETIVSRETTLAVLPVEDMPAEGEFGWSMPAGEGAVPLTALPQLLTQAGINRVKLPIWLSMDDQQRSSEISVLDERLHAQHIELIGVLDEPPAELKARFGEAPRLLAADIFSQPPELWHDSLEPAMTALSMRVRWWQLGSDGDSSFVGYPDLTGRVGIVKQHLEKFGPKVKLALGWGWINELPQQRQPPWQALNLQADPPLTAGELTDYLQGPTDARRWVNLQPLPEGEYSTEDRASDLVRRMVAAKIGGAEGIFMPNPLQAGRGLLNPDGTPGELLLPWRTAAIALAGASHLGSVELEGKSRNEVFNGSHGAVMVVWNETPRQERLYLGEDAVITDVWGRTNPALREGGQQVIEVGPVPVLVKGISEPIIRIAMQAGFAKKQIPSVLGVAHDNSLQFVNHFPQGAGGRLRIVAPEGWVVQPSSLDFKLAAGEELRQPLRITLPFSANSGPQPITLEFEINAGRKHTFSIQRQVDVGLGDVLLETSTKLDGRGDLIVEQRITNNTDEFVSFKCELSAPNQRLQRTQVLELGRGTDVQQYTISPGKDLAGKLIWLRAVEIGGPRVLSQRHVVKP